MNTPSTRAPWASAAILVGSLLGSPSCGTQLDSGSTPDPACRNAPTWYQDVQPLVSEHCSGCHVEGGIAGNRPWSSYEQTQPWAHAIAQTVDARDMPPFIAQSDDACEHRFPLLHDTRLAESEVEAFVRWAECGQHEGDPETAAVLPPPPTYALQDWDVEIGPMEGYAPQRGDIEVCFVAPIPDEWFGPDETVKWIDAMEVVPEDLEAAHHIHVQLHRPGIEAKAGPEGWWECTGAGVWGGIELGGWLPGSPPTTLPEGAAFPLRPDDMLTFQVHYHVTDDAPHFDATHIRFRFGDEPIYQPQLYRVGNAEGEAQGLQPGPNDIGGPEFRIPAGAAGHTETIQLTVPGAPGTEFTTFVVSNHMHQVGTAMRMWVEHDPSTKAPDEPLQECLLSTPRYDFDWQGFYYYDALAGQAPKIRAGDRVRVECTYDNTVDNEAWMEALAEEGLPQVPTDVVLGPESTDEMCASLVGALRLE